MQSETNIYEENFKCIFSFKILAFDVNFEKKKLKRKNWGTEKTLKYNLIQFS